MHVWAPHPRRIKEKEVLSPAHTPADETLRGFLHSTNNKEPRSAKVNPGNPDSLGDTALAMRGENTTGTGICALKGGGEAVKKPEKGRGVKRQQGEECKK